MGELELLLKVPGEGDTASPFEHGLRRVAGSGPLDLACPYLSVGLLEKLVAGAPWFRLVTDAEEWLRAFRRSGRRAILSFIRRHPESVRHYRDLHAKVALSPTLAMFGSANFTNRGLDVRQEVGAIVRGARDLRQLARWYDALWRAAVDVDLQALARYESRLPPESAESRSGTRRVLPPPRIRGLGRASWAATGLDWSADTQKRLNWYLRRLRSRGWAEQLFDSMHSLVEGLALDANDRRLVTSMQRDALAIGITINNRWVLGAISEPDADDRDANVYVLNPGENVAMLPAQVRRSVVDRGFYSSRGGDSSRPPRTLVLRDFSFARSRTFQRGLVRVCEGELSKAKRSSNWKYHSAVLYHAITDPAYRQRLFARVDWANA